MKKLVLAAIAATAAAATYGQGVIYINNLANTGVYNGNGGSTANPVYSAAVTQNGLIFTTDTTEQQGGGSTLLGQDFSWALYGGASASSLSLIASATTASEISGDNYNYGQILGSSVGATVASSTPGGTIYLDLYVWEGSSYSSYAAAAAGGDFVGDSGVFSNTSAAQGSPVIPSLTGLPDVLVTVPEPGTMALAALGGASLLLFRRKK
jgi:hypothetical protein